MYICSICKSELKSKASVSVHYRSFLHEDNIKAIERNKQFYIVAIYLNTIQILKRVGNLEAECV